jgi:dihydrofolate reductase
MTVTRLYMSMSLDGCIAGPAESPDNGLGDGGERLHEWVFAGGGDDHKAVRLQGVNRQVYDEFMSTGAVVVGRGTFEPAGGWPNVHYVDDLARAMTEAKASGDVLVHGAGITQRALPHGLLDELEITVVPILIGPGRRLFGDLDVSLERVRVLEGEGGVTHLRYRVRQS